MLGVLKNDCTLSAAAIILSSIKFNKSYVKEVSGISGYKPSQTVGYSDSHQISSKHYTSSKVALKC